MSARASIRPAREPELLLAVSSIASSGASLQDAVDWIERLLVDSGVCTGVVVLEKRGMASFPLAGNGGALPDSLGGTILSRTIKAGPRNVQVVLLSANPDARKSAVLAEFPAEQISTLVERDHLLDRRDTLKDRLQQMQDELVAFKLIARAKGLLMSKRDLSEQQASEWIEHESRKTGVAPEAVAKQIIAVYPSQPVPVAVAVECPYTL